MKTEEDAIKEADKLYPNNPISWNKEAVVIQEAKKQAFLKGFEYATQSKWISVKERMPDVGERVLVYCESQGEQICYRGYRNNQIAWLMAFDASEGCLNITHFQPLPTPPEK